MLSEVTDPATPGDPAPMLLVVEDDDGIAAPLVRTFQREGYAVERVATDATNEVARYAALLATGTYASAYLGVALSR